MGKQFLLFGWKFVSTIDNFNIREFKFIHKDSQTNTRNTKVMYNLSQKYKKNVNLRESFIWVNKQIDTFLPTYITRSFFLIKYQVTLFIVVSVLFCIYA